MDWCRMNDPNVHLNMTKGRPLQNNSWKKSGRLRYTSPATTTPGTWPFSINLLLTFANHWSRTKNWSWKKTRSLGGGNSNIFGIFIPKLGEDEPILTSIFFKWGWFNHQPDHGYYPLCLTLLVDRHTFAGVWKKCGEFVCWGGGLNEVNKVGVGVGGLLTSFKFWLTSNSFF